MESAHGISSSVFGGLSVAAAIAAVQFELLWKSTTGHVLDLARKLGILREPLSWETPEISNTTLLTITDGWVIAALGVWGVYLAAVAIAFALWAEHRGEDSLHLSVGFICACTAIFVLHPIPGILIAFLGAASLLAIRHQPRPLRCSPPGEPQD